MNKRLMVIPMVILAMLAIAGCGSNATADGVKNMKTVLLDLQKNIDANDEAKVKKGAEDLETNWAKFEDDVKKNNAAAYAQVEDPLGIIKAGSVKSPLDKALLTKAVNDLNAVLDTIK
jgi:predicted component of type VI protein secretion system